MWRIDPMNECIYYASFHLCCHLVLDTLTAQMAVRVWVMTGTATQFLRGLRPAVVKDSSLCLITSLPSVIHADPELMNTFANNLVQNVRIHHDGKTGKNTLTIDEQL